MPLNLLRLGPELIGDEQVMCINTRQDNLLAP